MADTVTLQEGVDPATVVKWRGNVSNAFRSRKAAERGMGIVATPADSVDVFRVVQLGTRWYVQVGQRV